MYRRLTKHQQAKRQRRIDAMRRGRERAAIARDPHGRAPELPLLRREITVIDYDTGQPITHTLHLYRSTRVDQYRAEADGKPWRDRVGWSKVLAALRKAYPRLPSPRSDFWR